MINRPVLSLTVTSLKPLDLSAIEMGRVTDHVLFQWLGRFKIEVNLPHLRRPLFHHCCLALALPGILMAASLWTSTLMCDAFICQIDGCIHNCRASRAPCTLPLDTMILFKDGALSGSKNQIAGLAILLIGFPVLPHERPERIRLFKPCC